MSTTELNRNAVSKRLMQAFERVLQARVIRAWQVKADQAWDFCAALGIDHARAQRRTRLFYVCEYERDFAGQPLRAITVLERDPSELASGEAPDRPSQARERTEALRYEVLNSPDMLNGTEAAQSIGASRQYIHQLHKNGELIGLIHPARQRGLQFPKWQFERGMAGKPLKKVLAALKGLDDWDKWLFFTSPDEFLCDLTPVQVLTREVDARGLKADARDLLSATAEQRLERVLTAANGYVND